MYLENNEVKRYPFAAIFAWIMVILWMGVIFLFSHQDSEASSGMSGQFAAGILRLFGGDLTDHNLEMFESAIRIAAHAFVFFVLGLLVSYAFEKIQVKDLRNASLSVIVSLLYAISDELHQVFVPGRAGELKDFLVDASGVVIAVIIYQVFKTVIDLRTELEVARQEELHLK
ncbi:MAG: VanZ family protein [Eubacteriales bacterium]|nr:VanZ family protein [Eubacteriales bacterium]MDD3197861.1 VanZ family protein [Eubacteriales bacterium]